jgi:hypothetical protein
MVTNIERWRMDSTLRSLIARLEVEWGTRPHCVLALQGGTDEHWQVWNPYDMGASQMPRWTVDLDCNVEEVPL